MTIDIPIAGNEKCFHCGIRQPVSEFERGITCKTCLERLPQAERRERIVRRTGVVVAAVGAFCAGWGGLEIGAQLAAAYSKWATGIETPVNGEWAVDRGVALAVLVVYLVFFFMLGGAY